MARGIPPRLRCAATALALLVASASARAAVEISGIEGAPAENVRAFLRIDDLLCTVEERAIRREFSRAPGQIREALEAFGFYAPAIDAELELAEECWTARVTITAGDPVRVRTRDIAITGSGQTDPAFIRVMTEAGLAVGEPLHHGSYDLLKRRISDIARDRGYANAFFAESRIDVFPDELAADIVLRFDSGERYRFGDVVIEQDVLDDSFVARYIAVEPGQPYESAALTETYVALTDSRYFDLIDVRPNEPDHEDRTIGVTVALTGAPRRQITYGLGFSTDQGPRLRFGRTFRRWNERGHQLAVDARLSPVISEAIASYRYPRGDSRYDWTIFDGGLRREDTETSESETLEFAARLVHERPSSWSRTELVNLSIEDFEIADQVGRSRLLMPGVDWTRLRADAPLRPRNGSRIRFMLRGAGDSLGSDTSFIQGTADWKWIRSLANLGRIITRGQLGLTQEESFDELPPSVRFFAGGDQSIRGYDFESLGPEDATGQVVGGTGIAVASFEYEQPVRPKWSVAFFVDSGNAFQDSTLDAKTSAGVGVRWQSPLGPIRLDIGVPIDDPMHDARLHVSIGPDL
jgi:translocation and assembly module TamA